MGKGFTKQESDALNSCVRGVVDRAVDSLQVLGMTKPAALSLLMIQAALRFENTIALRETLKEIGQNLADSDDDEDDGCGVRRGPG
jgi:hypothetical protein